MIYELKKVSKQPEKGDKNDKQLYHEVIVNYNDENVKHLKNIFEHFVNNEIESIRVQSC